VTYEKTVPRILCNCFFPPFPPCSPNGTLSGPTFSPISKKLATLLVPHAGLFPFFFASFAYTIFLRVFFGPFPPSLPSLPSPFPFPSHSPSPTIPKVTVTTVFWVCSRPWISLFYRLSPLFFWKPTMNSLGHRAPPKVGFFFPPIVVFLLPPDRAPFETSPSVLKK